jgi:hypothetical protein
MPTTYAVPDGRTVMAATTYTGNGSTQSINNAVNGVSFQPDFVWVKNRANGAADHMLVDSVRGATIWLSSDLTAAESTNSAIISSINSNGFSVGNANVSNQNATAIIGWQWKAGGTPAVTNTAGSITSTVSAGATQGFSVATFTTAGANATIGHGLGVAPKMILVKDRSQTASWLVYHSALGSPSNYLVLNSTAASASNTTVWNNTAPTSTVFSMGTVFSASNYVAYCFAEVAGYSKFGSYTGNNSDDGPFVYLGFRPRFIMVKRSDAVSDWFILDSSRGAYNANYQTLGANQAFAESSYGTNNLVDFLSNGFKIRRDNNYGYMNASGGTYIYAAFAENPLKYANAR